ncbi:site-2 protease family protein [Saprospiraceae bacterium]|nr:site-2 protease family protein [Saprospiraceae bacterium]
MFVCIILHEFGHSMAARRYSIETLDIIISPIGGLARLQDVPEEPKKEIIVALAGPTVNVVIATIVGCSLHFILGTRLIPDSDSLELLGSPINFLRFVFTINIMLFVFNLIPAFPMDGGRVLRALLSIKLERVFATRVAMWFARLITFAFISSNNITLGLIGVFIYVVSGKEYAYVKTAKRASSKVSEVLRLEYTKLKTTDPYRKVIDAYRSSNEKSFLVYDELENLVGAIPEVFIKDSVKNKNGPEVISDLMSTKVAIVSPSSTLQKVANMMNQEGIAICAVKDGEEVIGVIDRCAVEMFMKR